MMKSGIFVPLAAMFLIISFAGCESTEGPYGLTGSDSAEAPQQPAPYDPADTEDLEGGY